VDYENEEHAQHALNKTKGFRFAGSQKGISKRQGLMGYSCQVLGEQERAPGRRREEKR